MGPDDVPTIPGIENLELIGRGGFAVVYRGHQPAFRRDVAVKVLLRSGLGADDRRRFDRECQAMGALSEHPAIATLYDAGFTADERPYLVMPYVRDGTLGDRLASHGPLSWQEATALGVRLAGALETAHLAGVLHRDIKPANVLRAEYGEQLSDFGIARIAGGHETRSGLITASVAHAAPEILDGAPPTHQADVYALASTLYEALTGRPAFVRDTDEGLLPLIRRVITDDPPDLRERGVPDPVVSVIERAMAKNPAERHTTAREFGLALRGAQAVLGIPVTDLVVVRGGHDERTTAEAGGAAVAGAAATSFAPPATGRDEPPPTDAGRRPGDVTTDLSASPPPGPPAPPEPPPGADGDDATAGGTKRAALLTGVFVALIVLVLGLVVIARDGQPASAPTIPGTAGPGPSTGTDPTNPATTVADTAVDTTEAIEDGSTPPATTVEPPAGSDLRIGLVAPAVEPTHPIYAGVQSAADELGATVDLGDPQSAQDAAIFDHIANGQNTIVVLAPDPFRQGSIDAVLASADAHPEVRYIVLGAEVHAPNVASFPFADEHGSFLVGAAAALTSDTGRVGFLGGADQPEVQRYEAGFVAGVRHVSPTTQVDVRYLPFSFDDADLQAALAAEMYAAGADVIFHAATTGDGLFEAAAASGNWAIGVDTDQAATAAPGVDAAILTSMVRPYERVVFDALLAAADGSAATGVRLVDIADGVGWSTTGGRIDGLVDDLATLADRIVAQDIVVPTEVPQRALAPGGRECPPEGCIVRIIDIQPAGDELQLTLEANWVLDVAAQHAHYFFSPRYAPDQVGADSPARFGVEPGDWDLDDSYPRYVTEGAVSTVNLGSDTELICVTAADVAHNVLDPSLFDCSTFPAVG